MAGLLIGAAWLKTISLQGTNSISFGLLTEHIPEFWFGLAVVLFELVVAGALLSPLSNRGAWWIASACFFGFSVVASWKYFKGANDCGCLGSLQTPPWVVLFLDITILSLLALSRPPSFKFTKVANARSGLTCTSTLVESVRAIVIGLLITSGLQVGLVVLSISNAHSTANEGGLATPERLIGQRLPLFEQIDIGDRLEQGKWCVIFYREGCGSCNRLFGQLEHLSNSLACEADESGFSIAIVELCTELEAVETFSAIAEIQPVSLRESKLSRNEKDSTRDGTYLAQNCNTNKFNTGKLVDSRSRWWPTPILIQLCDNMIINVESDLEKIVAALVAN